MKGRSLKLREAHKGASPSLCSVAWAADGDCVVTASSSDPSILIHDAPLQHPPKLPKALSSHRDGVTCLALSPDGAVLASGSVDHSVKLHGFPGGQFQSNVTRFTLPIRSVSFNKSGSLLAAAGDDDGIKLITTVDNTISRVLKGHKGSVTGLSFDPNSEYLASVDGNGTVIYWELSSGKALHTLKAVAPDCGSDTFMSNMLSWSPDGEILAVPGLRNDVVMYDRDTAEKLFSLKGEHERAVCHLSWSPNGKYMATSSLDKQILIWDIDLRQDIERQKFGDRISCLAWKPKGNALVVIDTSGKFGVWDCPVPSCMKSPIDGAQSKSTKGLLLFEEDEQELIPSASLDGICEDDCSESAPVTHKRLRKTPLSEKKLEDYSNEEEDLLHQIESRKSTRRNEEITSGKEASYSKSKTKKMKAQEAFQPCSTPAQPGKRHFLCYNMLGSITTMENEGYSHIEVDFHDTGRGSRVPSMTDYFGFTMASLNETGSVFANPGKGEKKTSTLMYRPFSSWANNSEWSMRFEDEEVKVVALGTDWVAAITDLNFLRIFTGGGLQKHVISISGPVVTAAGFKDELAVVTHTSDCLPSGDQMLEVKVFNFANGTMPIHCQLPLTLGSCLLWFGYSEEGQPCAYDSKGVLRVYMNQFGGCWLPLFSAEKARQSQEETYWVVGLNTTKLFCILCKSPDSYPLVMPRPVLTLLGLSFPLASSDLGAGELENEFMMSNMHLTQTQKKIEEQAAAGLDSTTLDDEAFDMEVARDRCILRLIASCCSGDKLVRATELANMLSLEKSIKGAIKLVTALKLPILAERFNSILELRLLNENGSCIAASELCSKGYSIGSEVYDKNVVSGPKTLLPPPKLFSSQNSRQEEVKEKHKLPEEKVELLTGPQKIGQKKEEKTEAYKSSGNFGGNNGQKTESCKSSSVANRTEVNNQQTSRPPNPLAKVPNNQEKLSTETCKSSSGANRAEVNNQQTSRPPNPFAKAPNNHEKLSLFDSLKKMKKTDNDKKDASSKRLKVS